MDNPVIVEVTRGGAVESRHRGAIAVVDETGKTVFSLGDIDRAIFPRSAVKSLQALPLVEGGAADRYGLTPAELALACSSHSGEPLHAQTSAAMLAKAGRDPGCLECGVHWPMNEQAARGLARDGQAPTALHNNCSGKHAGFVCLSCSQGVDPAGYVGPDHAVQRATKRAMEDMAGVTLSDAARGVDGCSIPTYATPIVALARAFTKLGTGIGLPGDRAAAARRLREAVAAHPFMVAGTGRFDTRLMALLGARVFSKTGAEGVFCAALPEQGLGIALKCDDGQGRAAEVLLAAAIQRFLPLEGDAARGVAELAGPVMTNWNGIEVGRLRAVGL